MWPWAYHWTSLDFSFSTCERTSLASYWPLFLCGVNPTHVELIHNRVGRFIGKSKVSVDFQVGVTQWLRDGPETQFLPGYLLYLLQSFSFKAEGRCCCWRVKTLFSQKLKESLSAPHWIALVHWQHPISALVPGAREWNAWLELAQQQLFCSKGAVRGRSGHPFESRDFYKMKKNYLFIWLCQVLGVAYGIFSGSMWDLALWPGIEPMPPASGAQSLSHWTPRKVSRGFLTKEAVNAGEAPIRCTLGVYGSLSGSNTLWFWMDEILDVILIKEDNYLMRLCLCLSFLPTSAGLPLGAEVDCLHLLYKTLAQKTCRPAYSWSNKTHCCLFNKRTCPEDRKDIEFLCQKKRTSCKGSYLQCYLFAVERFHFSVGGLKVWGGDLCCALSNCRCLWEHTYFACLSLSFLIYRMRQKLLHGYKFMIILPALIAQFVVHRVHLIG